MPLNFKTKFTGRYTVNYQLMVEPELKMRLMELKTFHQIDVPEHIREMLREWVKRVEEALRNET